MTKLHRVSFSQNVLEHVGDRYLGKPYQILRLRYTVGRRLKPGEISQTGAYAILSGRNNAILRVSLCPITAHTLADGTDRFAAEVQLTAR